MSLYQQLLLYSFIIPCIFSFHPKIRLYKYLIPVLLALLSSSIFFILWDIYFTKIGVWGFNDQHHAKEFFINLPIEEILFFFVIPFCCLFTYFVFNKFKILNISINKKVLRILGITLIVLSLIFNEKLYTFSVSFLSGLIMLYISFRKSSWTGYFFSTYIIISLIPFLIVNGILTGYSSTHPPVWYNPEEMIGLRLITIPIEDFLYNFCLLYLNFSFFEFYKKI